jgi:cytochrome b561
MSAPRYTRTAVVLHWVLALLIFGMIGLAWYMTGLPKGPDRSYFYGLHKSWGLLAALLILFRLAWRLRHPAPPLPDELPAWQIIGAMWSHRLLYACMIIMPISGYLTSSFTKFPVKFFGLALPSWGWEDEMLNGLFKGVHQFTSYLLIGLILLHVAAAVSHATKRDGVMKRMSLSA